jgi:uncharacterized protein YrrD
MQNAATTKKWSDIKGLAAVTIDTGKKVGTVEDFYLDTQTHAILGFEIKTGVFSHRILLLSALNGIGVDAMTFVSEDALLKEQDETSLNVALKGKDVLSYRVLSEGGTMIGSLGNVIFSIALPQAINISAFELAGGLRQLISKHYPTFEAQQVLRYGQDVLVIPNTVAAEFIK